jgi:hypothetical protein
MFPPGCVPDGVYPSKDMSQVTTPVSLGEWLLNHYEQSVEKYRHRGREAIARSGDIVFVPCGWWHFVINLDDSVAITQNYVSRHNLAQVMLFLKTLPKSISGIGEDEEEDEEEEGGDSDDNRRRHNRGDSERRRRTLAQDFEACMRASFPAMVENAFNTVVALRRNSKDLGSAVCFGSRKRLRAEEGCSGQHEAEEEERDNEEQEIDQSDDAGGKRAKRSFNLLSGASCDTGFSFAFEDL